MVNGCAKGKVYEREVAETLRRHGWTDARRGQQHRGGEDSPDVVGLPGFHLEAKRVEAGNLYDWLAQATRDAGLDAVPVVVHRRNGRRSVAILDFESFLSLVKASQQGGKGPRIDDLPPGGSPVAP